MHELSFDLWLDLAHALGIGLFVGLEREHSEIAGHISPMDSPAEHSRDEATVGSSVTMGVRTFALLGLLGWTLGVVGQSWPWLPPVGLAVVGGMILTQYVVAREFGHGLTTEAAALMTFVMGMMVTDYRNLSVALAIATTLLLISKRWMHGAIHHMRRVELTGALQLLILLAIVLPLLPTEPLDPWDALPPRKLGLFVVLIAGLGYVGYVLTRVLGTRRGVVLTGLFGGLTSSTAVTIAMAKGGRAEYMVRPGQLATFIANGTMFLRVIAIVAVVNPALATRLTVPLGAMGVVMFGAAIWRWRGISSSTDADGAARATKLRSPFALVPALTWGAILAVVLVAAALAYEWFGTSGLLAAAGISGLADVDAITLAVSEQSRTGVLDGAMAATAVTLAVMSNTVVKAAMAYAGGGRHYARPIIATFAATIAVGAIVTAVA